MKWISKYDLENIEALTKNATVLDPISGYRFSHFMMINEETVLLMGSKDLNSFDKNMWGKKGILLISKDQGKSFQEIIFPEENVTNIIPTEKYTLIETNSGGFSPTGKNVIYLFDNNSFQYSKYDEYFSNNKTSYKQFNGKFVIYSNENNQYVLNIFTKEKYKLPNDITHKNFILSNSDATITFLKNENQIVLYNAKDNSYKILKELKDSYSTINNTFGEIYLGKSNLLNTSATVYDFNEKELFTIYPKEEKGRYRYKNFACYFKETRPYVTFYYSYDYGKSWYEYHTKDFFSSSNPIGFYKDKFILMKAGFYNAGKDENSNIIIGKFQK